MRLRSVIIASSQLKKVLNFYELLGLVFQRNHVSLGTEFYTSQIENFEISFIEKNNIRVDSQPHYTFSFKVSDVELIFNKLTQAGFIGILDPIDDKEGKKAILMDPDGRSVEITSY